MCTYLSQMFLKLLSEGKLFVMIFWIIPKAIVIVDEFHVRRFSVSKFFIEGFSVTYWGFLMIRISDEGVCGD